MSSPHAAARSVSVIIPVFNGQDYLADALGSVAAQSIGEMEIIVVDDGSTDRTADVVHAFVDRPVRYIRQANSGAAAARQRGVDEAKGDLIAFLDADDLWAAGKLRAQIDSLEDGGADMIFANVEEFISPDQQQELAGQVRLHPAPLAGVSVITLLMRRDDFVRVGPFNADIRVGEFIDWYARAVDVGLRPRILPDVLARRRLHKTNQGKLNRSRASEYALVMKRVLDRRRAEG